jgi:hypothetical protein
MKRFLFLVPLCIIIVALLACGSTNTGGSSTPQATKTWQTTHTFTGNGARKTETFTVADSWKIQWSCKGNVEFGVDAPLYITVYNSDTKVPIDSSSTTCKATDAPTTGETEEHQGGNVYLDINAGIEWTLTIQELK